jgi:beta-glucosidase
LSGNCIKYRKKDGYKLAPLLIKVVALWLLFKLTKGLSRNEFEITKTPMDFVGLNYYTKQIVNGWKLFNNPNIKNVIDEKYISVPVSKVYPEGLYKLLMELKDYTSIPIYITENGTASTDKLEGNKIHDNDRIDYIKEHVSSCARAIRDGVNLKGYYIWSLLDNFEWTYGYSKRYGLIYVDFNTQERIIKDSGIWYSQLIRNAILK